MAGPPSDETSTSTFRSWIIVLGIAASFFLWGIFLFATVGDKEPPDWDFGVVQDVPGQSPYSTGSAKELPGLSTHSTMDGGKVAKQHVMGRDEASQVSEKKGEQ